MQKPFKFTLKLSFLFLLFSLIAFHANAQTKSLSEKKMTEKKIIKGKSKTLQVAPQQTKSTRKIKTSKEDKPSKVFDKQQPKGDAVSAIKTEVSEAKSSIEKDKQAGRISEEEYQKKKAELAKFEAATKGN